MRRPARLLALACTLALAWSAPAQAGAQPAKSPAKQPAQQPGKQPGKPAKGPPKQVAKDPAKVLDEARAALAKAHAFSYHATFAGQGELEGKVPAQSGLVVAARAQAGGWKVYARGGASPESTDLEIGFDGVTARSIRTAESAVVEKTPADPTSVRELAEFFATQNARALVAWELLAEKPIDAGKETPIWEGQQDVGGVWCDVVRLGGEPAKPDAGKPAAPGIKKPSQPKPAAPADQPKPAEMVRGVRYYFAGDDHLPRRIDRLGPPEGEPGADGVRSLTLADFKIDEQSEGGAFSLQVPDGFRIKVADRAKPNRPRPGEMLGDPDGLRTKSPPKLGVGDPAPAWSLKDTAGKPVALADFQGKVVIMDFWGTWCPWCVKAMPQLERVHQKYKDKGVAMLGMNIENDPRADPAAFMRRNKFTYATILKSDDAAKAYGVSGYPTLVVVGKDGKIVLREEGFSPDLEKKLSAAIDALLAK